MSLDQGILNHLRAFLTGSDAHISFDEAIDGLPVGLRGAKHPSVPHTPWRLIEHMRIAQWDILEFSRNPLHISPEFPDGYWPSGDGPPDPRAWDKSVEAFRGDLRAMIALVEDPQVDLVAPIPHGDGQTILREALLIADHNAYHLGQFVVLRKLLEAQEN
ncbi:DinB family protein [Tundrisphaera lichenicola]|uniref:DinB family protein n=1 Tax=Tundrisphaera lichenicola TaxID=2029860 RepID=UPI003EB7B05B